MSRPSIETVINAAGKLTALGGSAQSEGVANAQRDAARKHLDLAGLRAKAGAHIALLTGAEAACVTSGAAAGISISVAAVLTGTNLHKIHRLPDSEPPHTILLQAGHAVNFGAAVTQMIRLGGGKPRLVGSANAVSRRLLDDTLATESVAAMLFVQSHHCVQENMLTLEPCIEACHAAGIPLVVDAAAEEDLHRYIRAGADLVTYSGGKAFGGPTVGFICGNRALIEACELQFTGIARTMKVGKEAIAGLLAALDDYVAADPGARLARLNRLNERLLSQLSGCKRLLAATRPDEAGRSFSRVAITAADRSLDIRRLVTYLTAGSPSIRTRNHHLDQGIVLIDPRELTDQDIDLIAARLLEFDKQGPC